MAGTAIVTGATGGIGAGFIRAIDGMDEIGEIWAVGRNTEKLALLKSGRGKVVPVEADLSADGVRALAERVRNERPDVRLLINNAGVGRMGTFGDMRAEDVGGICRVNCCAPAELISLCLPYMRKGARILNISSAASFQPNPYLSMYSASKAFLRFLSRALGAELKQRGITVTCVCPGWVDTGMLPRTKDGKEIRYPGMIGVDTVVDKALRDSARGKDMSVPGLFAKYFRIYSKIVPTGTVMRQWTRIIRKYV